MQNKRACEIKDKHNVHGCKIHVISVFVNWYCSHACQNKLSYWVITRLLCSVQQNGQLNYGVVTSLPKSNSLNETVLFPTTTRIQTASILTEFDKNPDLKHAVGQPKRWKLCWGFSVKVQTATNTLITLFSLLFY